MRSYQNLNWSIKIENNEKYFDHSICLHFSCLFGQCTVQGETTNTTVPCNECITLSANGFGENVAAFVENFNSGQPVGWQFTQNVTIDNTCATPSPDGSPFMWMGSTLLPRELWQQLV